MTDLDNLVKTLNKSCKQSVVWTKELLLAGSSGCFCYRCSSILDNILEKQIKMFNEYFADCCYQCQRKCITHINCDKQFWIDERVEEKMSSFDDYCYKCQMHIDIKIVRTKLRQPKIEVAEVVEVLSDCLDLLQRLSDKIKN
jgi:hypothetical protein